MHVLVAGKGAAGVAAEAAKLAGVAKVLLAESDALEHGARRAARRADRLASPAPTTRSLAPATTRGKNVMPRVAALLDVMQVSDVMEVLGPDTFRRPTYAGNAIQTVKSKDAKKVVTIRTASFPAAEAGGSARRSRTSRAAADPGLSTFVEESVAASERPELAAAKIIISGGRALGSKEKFLEVILPVADKLGAAVGASRAAVDAGYAPNDWQVGQTGKIVAPDLYIACGISGAIQHLAGMKDSKVIVAINKDAEAPIFQVADYGLVADLFQVLPELEKELEKRAAARRLSARVVGSDKIALRPLPLFSHMRNTCRARAASRTIDGSDDDEDRGGRGRPDGQRHRPCLRARRLFRAPSRRERGARPGRPCHHRRQPRAPGRFRPHHRGRPKAGDRPHQAGALARRVRRRRSRHRIGHRERSAEAKGLRRSLPRPHARTPTSPPTPPRSRSPGSPPRPTGRSASSACTS